MIEQLRAALAADVYERGWAEMSAAEVVADGRLRVHRGELRLTTIQLVNRLGIDAARRVLGSLRAVESADPVVAEMMAIARNGQGIDVNNDDFRTMMDALAANQQLPMTTDDATAVKATSENLRSTWEVLELWSVKPGHIEEARRAE